MKSQEVRLGNYHFYHIVDKLDERGEYDEVCQIDAEDFRILENFDCPEYKPISLDGEWLLKFGFVKEGQSWLLGVHNASFSGCMKLRYNELLNSWEFSIGKYKDITSFEYVHTLQNLFFVLSGEELVLVK